jgi:hypothetical protein
MARALLSNGSVNKPQQGTVFYGVRAASVAMQWFGKHVSNIEAVFRGVRAKELSQTALQFSSDFSVIGRR